MLESYLLFLAKTLSLGIIGLLFIFGMMAIIARARSEMTEDTDGVVEITDISEEIDDLNTLLEEETLPPDVLKAKKKAQKASEKAEKRAEKKKKRNKNAEPEMPARLFILRFEGDMEASEQTHLREMVTAVLLTLRPEDEVLAVIESAGGYVHSYGLAAAQLQRIRKQNFTLTAAVDSIAASGGYLMASVAQKIIAAPFAIVGSVGVVAELPNFHRLLKRHNIDYEQHTAGEYKRTVGMFTENTDANRAKFQEELEDTHALFKTFVSRHRPNLNIEQISTGEHWHASHARHLGLIDDIITSDDYILQAHKEGKPIYEVSYEVKKPFLDRLSQRLEGRLARIFQWAPFRR